MNATRQLQILGQSLWLDNITRDLLTSGTLKRYIDEFAITGLTSNPTIFDQAIKSGAAYDGAIRNKVGRGLAGEQLLAHDSKATLAAAIDLSRRAARPNVLIKIPGTAEGLWAIEEAIFAGIPINVTLLFSSEQYLAAAEAYMRGVERRIEKGLRPDVASVASLFVSRWDVAVASRVPAGLVNHLGVAVGMRAYRSYCELLASTRWRRLMNAGGRPQRLLLASTGTKDPKASATLYVEALAAPFTVDTMPESTLKALAERGQIGAPTPADGGDCETVLAAFAAAGIDVGALAAKLQDEGAASFVKSWSSLMDVIGSKSATLGRTG